MRLIYAFAFVLGLLLHAQTWAQEGQAPVPTPQSDPGAVNADAADPAPAAEEPKKEPAAEGEPKVEPAAEGEPKKEPAVEGEPKKEPAADGEPKKEPAAEGEPKKEEPPKEPSAEPRKAEEAKGSDADGGYSGNKGLFEDLIGFPVHGRLALKWRGRWQVSRDGRDADQDLYQEVSADIGDTKKHTLTAHFSLRVSEDLDGEHHSDGAFAFDSLSDTYSKPVHGDVYYAHIDLHRLLFVETIRAGRQTLDETPMVWHMDGIRVDSMPWEKFLNLQAGAYAGIPVHYYESSWRGDAIYGAWAQVKPWKGGRGRVEYTWIRDAYRGVTNRDGLWTFSAWQTLWEMLTLYGRYTTLNSRARDHNLRADLYVTDWDLRINAAWYRLYRTQELSTIDTDYFNWTLHSYFPYDQLQLLVAKGLGAHINLQAGAEMREVSPYDDEGPGNRSFQRYFFSPGLLDWPIKGLSATATLEYWNVKHHAGGDTRSAGFDVTWKPHEGVKISAGSTFALYKYDVFEDVEREHVQTYYLKLSWSPVKHLKFDLGYQLEDSNSDDFHTVKFAVSYTF